MSSNSGIGGAVGTLAGMALLYWMAVALAGVFVLAILGAIIGIVLIIATIYGIFAYLSKAGKAIGEHNREEILRLVVAPMSVPLGILVGTFLTQIIEFRTFSDYMATYNPREVGAWTELAMIFFPLFYALWLWWGWIIAGIISYSNMFEDMWRTSFLLWFSWGFGWTMAVGWSDFVQLMEFRFG